MMGGGDTGVFVPGEKFHGVTFSEKEIDFFGLLSGFKKFCRESSTKL